MKKLLTIILVVVTVAGKAQDTTKIPTPVAKQIVKDLISGDSAKAELKLVTDQLLLTEQKVVLKDSIISNHIKKGSMYEERIKNEQLKFDTQGLYVSELEKKNRKLKAKLLFVEISLSAITTGAMLLYLRK